MHAVLERHGLDYRIDWTLGGEPFLTPRGELSAALGAAIRAETGRHDRAARPPAAPPTAASSRSICPQVVEFGPVNASIHKIDEHVAVADIEPLKNIYRAHAGAAADA